MKKVIIVLLSTVLMACASGPYSVLEFSESDRTDNRNYDVVMTGLDGKLKISNTSKSVEPGEHFIQLATTKKGRNNFSNKRNIMLETKPCVRYYITAQHESGLSTNNKDWDVRVLRTEPIKHCESLVESDSSVESKD